MDPVTHVFHDNFASDLHENVKLYLNVARQQSLPLSDLTPPPFVYASSVLPQLG